MYNGQAFSLWSFFGLTSGGKVTDTTQPVNVSSPYRVARRVFNINEKLLLRRCLQRTDHLGDFESVRFCHRRPEPRTQ